MPVCRKCNTQFPNHLIIDGRERNLQNRKFCLICSPFGKHNTSKLEDKEERTCPKCNQRLPIAKFYSRRGKAGSSVYCKECSGTQTIARQQKFKELCVEYKGGKCEFCGYNRCLAALEFHHTDPKAKDFSISRARLLKLDNKTKTKKELDKCRLACANCHREIHWNQKYPRQDSNLRPIA